MSPYLAIILLDTKNISRFTIGLTLHYRQFTDAILGVRQGSSISLSFGHSLKDFFFSMFLYIKDEINDVSNNIQYYIIYPITVSR
ncbi:MAG: hypothetical protein K0R14_2177 [Burkholderiales bacterium]|jgi:hypothetical protein|nr:hypothetical protein [Burkholderiales bacterium]